MRFAPGALVLAIWLGGCAAPVAAPTLADATEAEAIELRVTVSDAGCSLEPAGTTSIAAGPIVLVTLNQTDAQAGVDLWRITEDGSFDQLAVHVDDERADAEAGGPGLGHPGFVTGQISSGIVEPGATTRIEATAQAGTHGIVCLRHFDAVAPDPFRPFTTIGPIEAE